MIKMYPMKIRKSYTYIHVKISLFNRHFISPHFIVKTFAEDGTEITDSSNITVSNEKTD